MTSSTPSPLLHQRDSHGILTLTLNRPERRNAFDDQLIEALLQVLDDAAQDDAVRVLCLQGAGEHFSAGADLNWMKRMALYTEAQNHADALQLAELMHRLYHFEKPTLALVQGACMGGAVGLAACCDVCLASPEAFFSLSEVRLGLTPATISPFVVRAIGARQATRYLLSGERIPADKAQQLGLCHEVVSSLPQAAQSLFTHWLDNGPQALAITKTLIHQVDQAPLDDAIKHHTSALIAQVRTSPEAQEGLSAFLEKRAPAWRSQDAAKDSL